MRSFGLWESPSRDKVRRGKPWRLATEPATQIQLASGCRMTIYNLEDVFVTEGIPQYTFVEPPNYTDILIDVRKQGKPVIIEGQSGTGKTTAIKRIIQQVGREDVSYLSARQPADLETIDRLVLERLPGFFVIDDFHRLSKPIREHLANIAKLAAEQGENSSLPKLVIIGINQVGSDLIQLVPDIAKRTGIHRIHPGTKSEINTLICAGCEKLNVTFDDPDAIFVESKGDYWLTQQLCQAICSMAKVTETAKVCQTIHVDTPNVRNRVVNRLQATYYPAVKEFCRGRRFRPGNDPYFKLLRTVGKQESSVVDLSELANSIPDVRGSINNIKDGRLQKLLDSKAQCRLYFYYNIETRNFAIEDPALFYFIKHLDWDRLRSDCGFRDTAKEDREWDVAISFAGENRELARHIAESLEFLDVHVFFDEFYEDNYLGRTWGANFKTIFADQSDLVVCLLDQHHEKKIWPTFERDCFVPRVLNGEVIPIFLDDTVFPGIPRDIVSIYFKWEPEDPEWKRKAVDSIVLRLIDRIA